MVELEGLLLPADLLGSAFVISFEFVYRKTLDVRHLHTNHPQSDDVNVFAN